MDVFTCSLIIDWLGCYGKGSESDVRHSVWLSFHIHESIISLIGSEFDFEAIHSNRITVNKCGWVPPSPHGTLIYLSKHFRVFPIIFVLSCTVMKNKEMKMSNATHNWYIFPRFWENILRVMQVKWNWLLTSCD